MTISDLIRVNDSLREMGGFFRDQLPDLLGEYPDQSSLTLERAIMWGRTILNNNPDKVLKREIEQNMKKWDTLMRKDPVWIRAHSVQRPPLEKPPFSEE